MSLTFRCGGACNTLIRDFSVTRCWNIKWPKLIQKLPKKWLNQFHIEGDVFQNSLKVKNVWAGYFCKEICCHILQKQPNLVTLLTLQEAYPGALKSCHQHRLKSPQVSKSGQLSDRRNTKMPTTEFEPRVSCVRNDHSNNCATTTAQEKTCLCRVIVVEHLAEQWFLTLIHVTLRVSQVHMNPSCIYLRCTRSIHVCISLNRIHCGSLE